MFFISTELEMEEAQQAKIVVIRKSLESDDKLFHSSLYNWYIEQGLVEELLHVTIYLCINIS